MMWVCDIIINLAVITIVIMLGLYIISGDENASNVILKVGQGMPEVTPVERMAAVTSVMSMKQVSSKKQEALASKRCTGF